MFPRTPWIALLLSGLFSFPASSQLLDAQQDLNSRWETTSNRGVLVRTQPNGLTVPPEECVLPATMIPHHSFSPYITKCTYRCIRDTDCPYGYLCACKEGCYFTPTDTTPANACISLELARAQRKLQNRLYLLLMRRLNMEPVAVTPSPESCANGFSEAYGVCNTQCDNEEDCQAGETCRFAICVNRCSEERACPTGYECVNTFLTGVPLNHHFAKPHCAASIQK